MPDDFKLPAEWRDDLAGELLRFHNSSCYPSATDNETEMAIERIEAIITPHVRELVEALEEAQAVLRQARVYMPGPNSPTDPEFGKRYDAAKSKNDIVRAKFRGGSHG